MTEPLVLGPADPRRIVLFAVGAAGDPERHRPLLDHLADHGCRVIAPRHERLTSPNAPAAELLARPQALVDGLRAHGDDDTEVVAVGHSIGGWAALCLAGATPWTGDDAPLDVPREPRVRRLVLYTPAAGWFGAPGALDAVTTPMLVYAGELDAVTPADQIAVVTAAPGPVDLRVVPGAGHFSFMHTPPPGVEEDVPIDRDRLLTEVAESTLRFALSG